MKIRTKMIVGISIVLIISLFIVTSISIYYIRRSGMNEIEDFKNNPYDGRKWQHYAKLTKIRR